MPEGLSAQEVGKEIAEPPTAATGHERRDRLVSIAEAVLLSIVALLAAWSGYAAAKWSTESRVILAEASASRTKANRANLEAIDLRNFDSSTFEAWFAAYAAHNQQAMALADIASVRISRRIRGMAHHEPETNPNAPRGPTYMPQYRQPGLTRAKALDEGGRDLRAGASAVRHPTSTFGDGLPRERPVHSRISTQFPLRACGTG